jgi:MFS-type transporter involved in bile tolerance (Atg22 family)
MGRVEALFITFTDIMSQGGIQALSRSYFAKIIPNDKSGEYFGILDICGKGASFLGTTLVSLVSIKKAISNQNNSLNQVTLPSNTIIEKN